MHRLILPILIAALAGAPAQGDDHGRAREWVEQGRILPLPQLLGQLPDALHGRLLEVELDDEHGRNVYELTILDRDGRVWEIELDAATGELLEREREHD